MFRRGVSEVDAADLRQLLEEKAVENVLLEFKAEVPSKDEYLKKVTSFANTYGGHIIVGAAASGKDGRLESLPGVAIQSGLRQKLVQWAYDATSPLVEVFVSDPIAPDPGRPEVCYVIHVPMSATAPHFIEGRRGCYIRTDEFSQRFDAHLATYEEIEHLRARRQSALERRQGQFNRSIRRFDTLAGADYGKGSDQVGKLGVTLMMAIGPSYPTVPLIEPETLRSKVRHLQIPWRQVGFPWLSGNRSDLITQHESVLLLHPAGSFSLIEVSTWGQLFFGVEVEHLAKPEGVDRDLLGIHLWSFLGHVLAFLEYSVKVYREVISYDGGLVCSARLVRILGKPFLHAPNGRIAEGPVCKLDDEIQVELPFSSMQLATDRDGIAKVLLRDLLFAMNWADLAADDFALEQQLARAYTYNFWPPKKAGS